jgi:DNA-binding transcriptional MerR regulator
MKGSMAKQVFSAGQASRLGEVRYRTLDYWARSKFLAPSAQDASGKGTDRKYTFLDIIQLRVARRMREAGISLQGLRRVQRLLKERGSEAPFANVYLVTNGRDVFELKRGHQEVWSMLKDPGQGCYPWIILDLDQTVKEVTKAIEQENLEQRKSAA